MTTDVLARPLRLACGATLTNRLAKAAMTEGLADAWLRATPRHERLYRTWSEGGAGLLLTGNLQVDRFDLERPANVAIDHSAPRTYDAEARARLQAWARAGTAAGNHLWVQVAHAGRQSPRYVTGDPVSPSAVRLDLLGSYATPRALTEREILDLIGRFAHAARVARETGFTGVQVHGAHGYLVSSFLSPVTNRRTDAWGGPLGNRARFLLECVRAVRRAVGHDFPVAVKLNSDDFRKGGFSHEECLQVVQWLNRESIDLLEISGGTYEQPRLIGFEGRAADAVPVRPSTRAREAYFLDYAAAIRRVATMPLMVTGGFRSRGGMEAALGADDGEGGDCDVIGLGRPLCWMPDFPRRLLAREIERIDDLDRRLYVRERGWLSPQSRAVFGKALNAFAAQSWYYCQLFRLADGQPADLGRGSLQALGEYVASELRAARATRKVYRRGRGPVLASSV
ncbi:MAG TPA: NADH:flavin oxidoreductase/NADH oxidase family protein [Steroidobacteraceae bacterium]|nr:NADH:flavin oxidoreductase/NADH oxidase family protein [Steroidobacteraceae bacterium]